MVDRVDRVETFTDPNPRYSAFEEANFVTISWFRELFATKEYSRYGEFVDHGMSPAISEYSDWIRYVKGDSILEIKGTAIAISDRGRFLFVHEWNQLTKWDLTSLDMTGCWETDTGMATVMQMRHPLLAIGKETGQIDVLDMNEWHCRHFLDAHRSCQVYGMHFTKDGTKLVSLCTDVKVWDMQSGVCLTQLDNHYQIINDAFISETSHRIITSSKNELKQWDLDNGKCVHVYHNPMVIDERIGDICLNCDQSYLACASETKCVIMNWPDMKDHIASFKGSYPTPAFHPCISNIIAILEDEHTNIQLIRVESSEILATFKGSIIISGFIFTPDGQRLITVDESKSIRIWDLTDVV